MNPLRQQTKEGVMKRKRMSMSPLKVMSKGTILLAGLMLGILSLAPEGIAKTRTVTIVHTNNVAGHLFACPT
jgi:hypothetical protein